MMSFGFDAHVRIGVSDCQQFNVFAALGEAFVFGGVVMTKYACADNSGFQRSIFWHATSEKQGLGVPSEIRPL